MMQTHFLDPLYPITSARAGPNHVEMAEAFIRSGVHFFQVREKHLADLQLFRQLQKIRTLSCAAAVRFVVNDRIDLALACEADGVHLGQDDLPIAAARRMLGPNRIIGLSTHNFRQFLEAQQMELDYVAVGPIFETSTKQSPWPPLGIRFLEENCCRSRLPVVAIGGITLERVFQVWKAGAASAAVISDLHEGSDPTARIHSYLELAKHVGN